MYNNRNTIYFKPKSMFVGFVYTEMLCIDTQMANEINNSSQEQPMNIKIVKKMTLNQILDIKIVII